MVEQMPGKEKTGISHPQAVSNAIPCTGKTGVFPRCLEGSSGGQAGLTASKGHIFFQSVYVLDVGP